MAFWSRLPVEFDEGGLVPAAVTRERYRAHLRECYPMLYQPEDNDRPARHSRFAAGFVTGAAAALMVSLALLSLR